MVLLWLLLGMECLIRGSDVALAAALLCFIRSDAMAWLGMAILVLFYT